MRILLRLAARFLEPWGLSGRRLRDRRDTICSFLEQNIFLRLHDHIPPLVVKFAFHQFVLYWWAVPQKYKSKVFDIHQRLAPGLEGDFLLAAAEAARSIYDIVDTTAHPNRAPDQVGRVTTYHSVKGGTGKSSLAIAHAVDIAQKNKKVAIIDLDFLNPSLLAMHICADAPDNFRFLEPILSSPSRPKATEIDGAFVSHPQLPSLVFGSVFGPGRERGILSTMLNRHIEEWRVVVDNLRVIVGFLLRRRGCTHVVIDNSPGLFGLAIPSAIVAAERGGTFVLVSTLDAFDAGNIPLNQASFDYLFRDRRRVLAFNKVPRGTAEQYAKDPSRILAQAWQEALLRAGQHAVVDVSHQRRDVARTIGYDSGTEQCLFVNVDAMLKERGDWEISFVETSRTLARFWHLNPKSARRRQTHPRRILDIPQLKKFVEFIQDGGG